MSYRVPDRLGYVVDDQSADSSLTVFLMKLPNGAPLELAGSAAWIWVLATEREDVVEALAELTGESSAEIGATTAAFLQELVGQGLLEDVG